MSRKKKNDYDNDIQRYRDIFSDNLQYFLDLNDMTQADLARALGVSEVAVHSWITAEKSPKMDKVARMIGCYQRREEGRYPEHHRSIKVTEAERVWRPGRY